MKWLGIGAVIIMVIAALYYWVQSPSTYQASHPSPQPQGTNDAASTTKQYSNATYGVSFAYPGSYSVTEREVGTAHRKHYSIVLTSESDLPAPEAGEGPPTISLDIFQNNLDALTLEEWLTGTNFSNFKLGDGRKASTTVGGVSAVRYRWSGLYEANSVAFLHRDNIIMVSGMYLHPADAIVTDFEQVIQSIRLQ